MLKLLLTLLPLLQLDCRRHPVKLDITYYGYTAHAMADFTPGSSGTILTLTTPESAYNIINPSGTTIAGANIGKANNGWNVTQTQQGLTWVFTLYVPTNAVIGNNYQCVIFDPINTYTVYFNVVNVVSVIANTNIDWQILTEMQCICPLEHIYISKDISNFSVPFGLQIAETQYPQLLQFIPGLMNFGGSASNLQVGLRLYQEKIADHMTFIQNPKHIVAPFLTHLAASPILIPWNGPMVFFVEFTYTASKIPAGSTAELTIVPGVV
ncbi:MAG: hypothetical protein QXZ36_03645 [Thermoproteota archaeon]